jgi:prepilin-type N-terminal cleavage/methylation domain-containing protein
MTDDEARITNDEKTMNPEAEKLVAGQRRHIEVPLAAGDLRRSCFVIRHSSLAHRGVSLMEVLVVLVVMGILISMSAPTFHRSIEQSWADIAGANLRAIWSAERLYWLEYRTYTSDLSELESLGLLDPTITSATTRYIYALSSADASTFRATATRTGSVRWTGQLAIDQSGVLSGVIQAAGQPGIVPGFQ